MDAQISLEHFAALMNFFQTSERGRGATVIAAKIDKRLFAFENRGRADLFSVRPIRGDIGAVTAARQTDFERARGAAALLRKNQREPLQTGMALGFTAAARSAITFRTRRRVSIQRIHAPVHSARSRAQ